MKESQIREHLQKGWIRCIVSFEIVGKPASHVEGAMNAYINNLKKDSRIAIIQEEHLPAEEVDDGMFSAIAEEEMLVKDLETLTWISINFSPASIEILDPDELVLPARDVTNWLNDLLANLHEVSASVRGTKNSVDHLTIAMNQLIQNSILLSVRQNGKNEAQICNDLGIHQEQIAPFLQHLVSKGKLRVDGGIYSIGNGVPIQMPVAIADVSNTKSKQQPKQQSKQQSKNSGSQKTAAKTAKKKKR